MIDTDHLSLKLPAIQKHIVMILNEFFTTKELETICQPSNIICPDDKTAIQACHGMDKEIIISENSFIKLQCILDVEEKPKPVHYLKIIISKGSKYTTELNCNPDINNPKYLTQIACRAINLSKFATGNGVQYNKQVIAENVAHAMVRVVPDIQSMIQLRKYATHEFYPDFKRWITYCADEMPMKPFECEDNGYKVRIEEIRYGDILKSTISNTHNGDFEYVYCSCNDLGANLALLAFDKAITEMKEKIYLRNFMDVI